MSEGGGALELLAPAAPVVTVRGSLGAGFERGNNLHVLAAPSSDGRGGVVAYAVGNAVRVHDLSSGSMRYVQGRDGGGVGALAVHPSRAYFAVAERRWTGAGGPRIYVYAFPSLACVRVLEGGTERGFSDVCFSLAGGAAAALAAARAASASGQDAGAGGAGAEAPAALSPAGGEGAGDAAVVADAAIVADGTGAGAASSEGPSDLFVSVGSFPDYSLIVWNWLAPEPHPLLRTKAFGQEVFNAHFSPDDPGRLVTSGVGHIRFWRLADTFTGLKLQGLLGKFGRVDISDVRAFAELPDGKVLSSSEGGYLLLWDGGVIKTTIGRAGPHKEEEEAPAVALEAGAGVGAGAGGTGAGAEAEAEAGAEAGAGVEAGGGSTVVAAKVVARPSTLRAAVSGAHDGGIHCVLLDRQLGVVVTGGDDGKIAWWDFRDVDVADLLPDGVSSPGLVPLCEVRLPGIARVRALVRLDDTLSEQRPALPATAAWAVMDAAGALWRVDANLVASSLPPPRAATAVAAGALAQLTVASAERVFVGHSGAVCGVAPSPAAPAEPYFASVGADGSVRCWHAPSGRLALTSRFSLDADALSECRAAAAAAGSSAASSAASAVTTEALRATCLQWLPTAVEASGRVLAVGFSDGTVRLLWRGGSSWVLLGAHKPHSGAQGGVAALAHSPDGALLASAGGDGTVFFTQLQLRQGGAAAVDAEDAPGGADAPASVASRLRHAPLGFCTLLPEGGAEGAPGIPATALAFAQRPLERTEEGCSWGLFVGCQDGSVRALSLPPVLPLSDAAPRWPDTSRTFDMGAARGATAPCFAAAGLRLSIAVVRPVPPLTPAQAAAAAAAAEAAALKRKASDPPPPPPPTEIISPAAVGRVTALLAAPHCEGLLVGVSGEGGHCVYELRDVAFPAIAPAGAAGSVFPSVVPSAMYPCSALVKGEAVASAQAHVTSLAALVAEAPGSAPPLVLAAGLSNGGVSFRAFAPLPAPSASPKALARSPAPPFGSAAFAPLLPPLLSPRHVLVQLHDGDSGAVRCAAFMPLSIAGALRLSFLTAGGDGAIVSTLLGDTFGAAALVKHVLDAEDVSSDTPSSRRLLALIAPGPVDMRAALAVGLSATPDASPPRQQPAALEDAPSIASLAAEGSDASLPPLPAELAVAPLGAAGAASGAAAGEDASDAADSWLAARAPSDAALRDPRAYSTEANCLRSAADAHAREAEVTKAETRRVIARLRASFAALRARATEGSAALLTEAELTLDPELEALLTRQGEERLVAVDNECAYERQRRRVALSKLVKFLLGSLAVDSVVVQPLPASSSAESVATIPQSALSAAHAASIAQARASALDELQLAALNSTRGTLGGAGEAANAELGTPASIALGVPADALPGLAGAVEAVIGHCGQAEGCADGEADLSFDARRTLRVARRSALRALAARKPAASAEYGPDAAAVAWAKSHMGDYSLKASREYVPPEGIRSDAVAKRRQVLLLEGHLHGTVSGFNARLLTLRERRAAVLAALLTAEDEIRAIDAELSEGPTMRTLQRSEVDVVAARLAPASVSEPAASFVLPEGCFEGSTEKAPESLVALAARHVADALAEANYERAALQHATAAAAAASSPVEGGAVDGEAFSYAGPVSAFLSTLAATSARGLSTAPPPAATKAAAPDTSASSASSLDVAARALLVPLNPHAVTLDPFAMLRSEAVSMAAPVFAPATSSLQHVALAPYGVLSASAPPAFVPVTLPSSEECEAAAAAYAALCDRRVALKARQAALLTAFSVALQAMRSERSAVTTEVAAGRVRLTLLKAELRLLSDLGSKDAALENRSSRAHADKAAHALAVASQQATLATKRSALDAVQASGRALLATLEEISSSANAAALLKVFKKKVKRVRVLSSTAEGEESEDDDDDLGDLDEDSEEEDGGEERCPDGVERAQFEAVLRLREKRLDNEEEAAEITKAIEAVRKDLDRALAKEKIAERELAACAAEHASFQRDKQGQLNSRDTFVVLRASQVAIGVQATMAPCVPVPGAVPTPPAFAASAAAGGAVGSADDAVPALPLGELPPTIDHCVLFSRTTLARLRSRVGELNGELRGLAAITKALAKEESGLAEEKRGLEARVAAAASECTALQLLKFGRIIDVEALDRATGAAAATLAGGDGSDGVATSSSLAALQAEQASEDASASVALAAARARLTSLQTQLVAVTQAHTSALEHIAGLSARSAALDGELSGGSSRTLAGLQAVALHASLGMAGGDSAVAIGRAGGGLTSLSALAPTLTRIESAAASARATAVAAAVVSGAVDDTRDLHVSLGDPPLSAADVAAGLTLSYKGAGSVKSTVGATDDTLSQIQDAAEEERLAALTTRQSRAIYALRIELARLRSKGPAPPPPASSSATLGLLNAVPLLRKPKPAVAAPTRIVMPGVMAMLAARRSGVLASPSRPPTSPKIGAAVVLPVAGARLSTGTAP